MSNLYVRITCTPNLYEDNKDISFPQGAFIALVNRKAKCLGILHMHFSCLWVSEATS